MTSDARERMLTANGLQFHALEWNRAGPRALFIHATSFCADGWRPVVAAVEQSDATPRRAIAVDQRGHGRSDAPDDPAAYQWTRLADDIAALAATLGAEFATPARVAGIGHSSGATALLAAAGMHPERFDSLVAIEPVLLQSPGAQHDADSFPGSSHLAAAARRRRDRFTSLAEARERLRSKPPYARFDPVAFEALLDGILAPDGDGVVLRCPGAREAACYDGAPALDLWPLAARIRAPLLLVLGEHSAVSPALCDRLLAATPSAQVVTIPGGTHFVALERPHEVGVAIARFLAEHT